MQKFYLSLSTLVAMSLSPAYAMEESLDEERFQEEQAIQQVEKGKSREERRKMLTPMGKGHSNVKKSYNECPLSISSSIIVQAYNNTQAYEKPKEGKNNFKFKEDNTTYSFKVSDESFKVIKHAIDSGIIFHLEKTGGETPAHGKTVQDYTPVMPAVGKLCSYKIVDNFGNPMTLEDNSRFVSITQMWVSYTTEKLSQSE